VSVTTAYIRLNQMSRHREGFGIDHYRAEFRIEQSEAYPDHLEIGVYGWNTGEELATLTLGPEAVSRLADALEGGTGEHPYPLGTEAVIATGRFHYRDRHPQFTGVWHDRTVDGTAIHVVPQGVRGKPGPDGEPVVLGVELRVEYGGQARADWGAKPMDVYYLRPLRQRETAEALRAWLTPGVQR
jgi:hypothetical protein